MCRRRNREAVWVAVLIAPVVLGIAVAWIPDAIFHLDPRASAIGLAVDIALRETVVFVLLIIAMRRYLGLSVRDVGVVWPQVVDLGLGLVLGAALWAASLGLALLIRERTHSPIFHALGAGDFFGRAAATLLIGLWSPFVQEVFFRGALLPQYR